MEKVVNSNRFRILVVDDDSDLRDMIKRWITSLGHDCETAKDGKEGVDLVCKSSFDLAITDMVMPRMDGMEFLEYTKEHCPNIDVIVMTGFSSQYSYIDVIHAGAADFITKPFEKDEFSAKLNRVCREKSLLEELKKSKEEAESGSRAKTSFLCTISHELRTPMNGILGFSGLLKNVDLPSEAEEYVDMVSQSADRLMALINQILDFAEIEAGKNDIHTNQFQINTVLENLYITVNQKAEVKGLEIEHEIDPALENEILFGDQLALTQILHHLMDNAIKFTDSGSIKIKIKKVKEIVDSKIELQFSVEDSGCGIEPEKLDNIFKPFTQAEDYMTRKHDGAGLGLAICAKLATMIDGKIWVDSSFGAGSTFYFTVQMSVT